MAKGGRPQKQDGGKGVLLTPPLGTGVTLLITPGPSHGCCTWDHSLCGKVQSRDPSAEPTWLPAPPAVASGARGHAARPHS